MYRAERGRLTVNWSLPEVHLISTKSGRLVEGQEPLVVNGVKLEPLLTVKSPSHLKKNGRLK